ncbi:MAG TPA: hypothetical protein VJB35_04550 [Candidatus Nanoarchaeia archaeon]|nr:hypothetical protein [Candidatus Nanoarchaeia archaeon]
MLNSKIVEKIENFVEIKPRSVQEIAQELNKNWRTVDRYISQIKEEFGTIETRIFREGTRGALKIVYFANSEKISSTIFQERLEKEILLRRTKEEFSAFEIFQYVQDNKKEVFLKKAEDEKGTRDLDKFFKILLNAQKQVLFFSGNLSFLNIKNNNQSFFDIIEKLVEKNIKIKVLCRVDIVGRQNIEKLLSLNFKHQKELIQIRHREHPLRATIIDDKIMDLKEIKEPTGKIKELDKKIFIFYTINDKKWIEWLTKIFWKMFNESISAEKRLEQINRYLKL